MTSLVLVLALAGPAWAASPRKPAAAPPVYEEDFEDANVQATGGLVRFGEDVVVQEGEQVDGPVVVVGGSARVEGSVNGAVISIGGSTELGPRAEVNGPAVSVGGRTARASGSRVEGPIVDTPGSRFFGAAAAAAAYFAAASTALLFLAKLSSSVGWIVLGAILLAVFPGPLRATRDALERRPAECVLAGLLAWPGLTLVLTTLALSIIGLPLAPLLLAPAAATYVWGYVALGWWVGVRLSKDRWDSPMASMLLGMLVLRLLQWLTLAKWAVALVASVLGVGAALVSRFGLRASAHRAD